MTLAERAKYQLETDSEGDLEERMAEAMESENALSGTAKGLKEVGTGLVYR
ncbi:hypothetical protein E8E11_010225 [Didymella keratinophila]|nr:hypothetical protein E8E11_010225 [Didymella keratinophila]